MAIKTQIDVKFFSALVLALGALNWIFVAIQMDNSEVVRDIVYMLAKDTMSSDTLRQTQMIVYSVIALSGAYEAYHLFTKIRDDYATD